MEQKKYLSFPQKLSYGTDDLGSNFFYMLVTSFTLIYLTDTIGLNPAIIGTLIMVSKFIYGGIPLILTILNTVCLAFMKVEEDNKKLEKAA